MLRKLFGLKKKDHTEANQAVSDAQDDLSDIISKWPRIERASTEIERIRRENHFADTIRRALNGEA